MTLSNAEVAGALELLADLLEIEGVNPFRVRAYRTAARTVLSYRTASRRCWRRTVPHCRRVR